MSVYVVKYPNGRICGVYEHESSMELLEYIGRDYETNAFPSVLECELIKN